MRHVLAQRPSITLRLIVGLTTAASLLWCAAVALASYASYQELNLAFDRAMREVAFLLLPLAEELDHDTDSEDTRVLGRVLARDGNQLSYQVRNASGHVLLRANDAPLQPYTGAVSPGFANVGSYRVFTLADATSGLSVTVAESQQARWSALVRSAGGMLWPLAVLIPLNGMLVVWQVRTALRPLRRLSHELGQRNGSRLDPIPPLDPPAELQPIADAVDSLLGRVRTALEWERSFTSNSAHELRTPIAAGLAQAQRLLAETDDPQVQHRAQQLETSFRRLAHLSAKLLELARAESPAPNTSEAVDLLPVLDLLVQDLQHQLPYAAQLNYQRNHGSTLSARFPADAFAIAARNLLENAMLHRSPDSTIALDIQDGAALRITNAAVPLDPQELAQLTQRFTRGARSSGSGLGLAIVAALAEQHGARLALYSPIRGQQQGFEAVLHLPA